MSIPIESSQAVESVPAEKQVAMLTQEVERLHAAIHTIYDHLHHGRVNEAHQSAENACEGEPVAPPHIALNQAARVQRFISSFNNLASAHEMIAAAITLVPSSEDPRKVSIQLGGAQPAVAIIQEAFGAQSTMAGQHEPTLPRSGGTSKGGIIIP
jgi:hypothetical protein